MPCLQTPVLGCGVSVAAFTICGPAEKSKNSIMLSALASRRVKDGTLKVSSIRRKIDVESRVVCETKLGLVHGEITRSGMRNPLWLKSPKTAPAFSCGAIVSG